MKDLRLTTGKRMLAGIFGLWLIAAMSMGCAEGRISDNGDEQQNEATNESNGEDPPVINQGTNENEGENGGTNENEGQNSGQNENQGPNEEQPCDGVECAAQEVCNPDDGECVDCVDTGDCTEPMVCDEQRNNCVECVEDGDCSPELVCNVPSRVCVECVDGGDCDEGMSCEPSSNTCQMAGECIDGGDCTEGQVCDDEDWVCVECVDDGDCEGDVCDPEFQECVECVEIGDCDQPLVCDETGKTCVECLNDGDCAGTCHPDYAACMAPCCNFNAGVAGTNMMANFGGYGVATDTDGDPVIGVADRENDQVVLLQGGSAGWSAQIADTPEDIPTITYLDVGLEDDDTPHLVLANQPTLTHYWRDGASWESEQLAELESGSFGHVSVEVDFDGTVHIMARMGSSGDVFYGWRKADGSRGEDEVTVAGGGSPINWLDMAVRTDGLPVLAATVNYSSGDVYIIERTSAGGWDERALGEGSGSGATLALDADDEVWVATDSDDGLVVWEPDAG